RCPGTCRCTVFRKWFKDKKTTDSIWVHGLLFISNRDEDSLELEIPVFVFGVYCLADYVRRTGTREEVVVFVSVRAQCSQNRRRNVGYGRWEHRLVAQVHQSLIGVVVQELLDVLGQAYWIVKIVGVLNFVFVQFVHQLEGVVLQLLLALFGLVFQTLLEL